MRNAGYRAGVAEFATLAGLAAVVMAVVLALRSGWTVVLIPAVAYVLATGAAYLIYRQNQAEAARAAQPMAAAPKVEERPARAPVLQPGVLSLLAASAMFRVVDVRGACPLGHQKGDLLTVEASGAVQPRLCAPAEAVLRLAAAGGEEKVSQWCCPIYDHLLVFQREGQAA